jgi:hypothetical protein
MAVRKETDGELALYASNETLEARTVRYTVTAYDEDMSSELIASGVCKQAKNSASLIQRIAEGESPKLWIIKWSDGEKGGVNHVFTGNSSYEVMREWVKIIEKESGFEGQFLELIY